MIIIAYRLRPFKFTFQEHFMQKKFFLLFLAMLLLSLGTLGGCDGSSSGNKNSTSPPSPEPPQWSSGYPSATTLDTNLYIQAYTNESGNVYCVVLPDGSDSPSALQVKNGQDATGLSVASLMTVSDSLSESNITTFVLTGLSYSTVYDLYIVAEDDSSLLQTSATIL
ncbi:MAG TPA: hypothetical protein PK859_14910, partial [Spirochaetota bacterium]|nr:hypothetical protein [Spirochaetota bacterium]